MGKVSQYSVHYGRYSTTLSLAWFMLLLELRREEKERKNVDDLEGGGACWGGGGQWFWGLEKISKSSPSHLMVKIQVCKLLREFKCKATFGRLSSSLHFLRTGWCVISSSHYYDCFYYSQIQIWPLFFLLVCFLVGFLFFFMGHHLQGDTSNPLHPSICL